MNSDHRGNDDSTRQVWTYHRQRWKYIENNDARTLSQATPSTGILSRVVTQKKLFCLGFSRSHKRRKAIENNWHKTIGE